MNSNTNDVPFHERHDDELLTLDDVAQILKTSDEHRPLVAPGGHRPGVLQDRPAALHDRRRPAALHPLAAARLPAGHRQAEGGVRAMDDPRHVFLSASEVMARYGWGKTKGYQNLKDRELVPPPVMTHPDRWRLDQLLAWEEKRMALAEAALEALVAPGREPTYRHRPAPPTQATAADGMMHAGEFSKIAIFRDVRNSAIIEKWPESCAHLTLPSEGYGDEPKSEADVLLTAAARIQAALPAGWTVQANTEVGGLDGSTNTSRRPGSRLSLMREGKTVATYARRGQTCPGFEQPAPRHQSAPRPAGRQVRQLGPDAADVGRSLPQHPAAAGVARTGHRLRRRNRKPVPDIGRPAGPAVRSRCERRSVARSRTPDDQPEGPPCRPARACAG